MGTRSSADLEADLEVAIQASTNGRFLVRHTRPSDPFFLLNDTAWETFHRLDLAEAEMYLRHRASQGFNSVMAVIFAEHNQLDFPNRQGDYPFFPRSPSGPYEPDFYKPNPAYFAFVDKVVALASSLGITLMLVPTWGRWINGGYYGGPIFFDEASARSVGQFLGERYPFHPFILGGDSNRYWNTQMPGYLNEAKDTSELERVDYGPVFEAMGRGLAEGEKKAIAALDEQSKAKANGYETFLIFHSAQVWMDGAPETSGSAQFPHADWLSLDCIQTGHHDGPKPGGVGQAGAGTAPMWKALSSYLPVRAMYNTPRPDGKHRPVIDLEAHYESTNHYFDANFPMWSGDDIRSGCWQALFAGACGYTYGVNSIWQMHDGESKTHPPINPPTTATVNWYEELDLPGAYYVSIAQRILLSLPNYFSRIPDNAFILSDRHEPSDGSAAGDKLIQGTRGKGWAMVHLPYGGPVGVDLAKALQGKEAEGWKGWWVDPRTGARTLFVKGKGDQRTLKAQSPSEGSQKDDWLLLVVARSATLL